MYGKNYKKKDYIKKGLHKRNTTYYMKKKIYRKKLYRKKNQIKDGVRLYEEKLHRSGTKLYK